MGCSMALRISVYSAAKWAFSQVVVRARGKKTNPSSPSPLLGLEALGLMLSMAWPRLYASGTTEFPF